MINKTMAVVNKFNVNREQVTFDADIIENMSANDVSYNSSLQYDENTVGDKLSELEKEVIYDVSAHNNGVTFASLSALLSDENLSTLIPTSVRHGGMSIHFVKSSDNKYVGIKQDGSIIWIGGVPQLIKDYVENLIFDLPSLREKVEVLNSLLYTQENQEFFQLLLDKNGMVIESIDNNGKKTLNLDVFVAGKINDNDIHYENSVEYTAIVKDTNGKIFIAFRDNGEPEFGIKYPKFVIDTITKYLEDYQKFPIDFWIPKISDSWLVVGDGCEGGMKPYFIAFGKRVLANNTGIKNITVGYDNMYQCTGHDNTSMGYHASFRNTSGIANAAFGSESQDDNLAGGYNASIGFCSCKEIMMVHLMLP